MKCDTKAIDIQSTDSIKYLGLHIDSHLRWNVQIRALVAKIRALLDKFKLLRDVLSTHYLKILYNSLVQSQINYGILAWGGLNDSVLKSLEVVQKWILKVMFKRDRMHPSDSLYREAEVLDPRQLYAVAVMRYLYLHGEHITTLQHGYNTRQKETVCLTERCKKTIGQRGFVYLSQKLYNSIPEDIRCSQPYRIYLNRIKTWIFSTQRKYLHNIINNAS